MSNFTSNKKELSPKQREELLAALKARFEKNLNRHKGVDWAKVQAKLEANADKLWSLHEMERTGGEPDVVGHDKTTGEYIFLIVPRKLPKNRVSVCYDREGLDVVHQTRSNLFGWRGQFTSKLVYFSTLSDARADVAACQVVAQKLQYPGAGHAQRNRRVPGQGRPSAVRGLVGRFE